MKRSILSRLSLNPPSQVERELIEALLALKAGDKAGAVEHYRKADNFEMISYEYGQPTRWLVGTEDETVIGGNYAS